MVILSGGIGCTGKTLLANRLMRKTKIPYFPLDHLMMGIYRGMPDCDFTPLDDQFILGEKMWSIIKGLIMTNIENEHSIILEGFQLLPHLLGDFTPDYIASILSVFLFFSDRYIRNNFDEKIIRYRSAIENRGDIEDITLENLISMTKRLKKQCIVNKAKFFEIENDFCTEIQEAEDYVLAKMDNI